MRTLNNTEWGTGAKAARDLPKTDRLLSISLDNATYFRSSLVGLASASLF